MQQLFAGPDKDKDNSGSASETGKVGSVFRLTYNYKEKYMLEANGCLLYTSVLIIDYGKGKGRGRKDTHYYII